MIRRRTLVAAALALPAAAHAQEIGSAQRPLRIGVTAGPHAQVMEKVREIAARDGLAIRIIEFQDYIQPNVALAAGDLDANSYQHQPFLDQQVRDRRLAIVGAGKTLIFPMGIYSRRHRRLADVPNSGRVAIPNDPTNGGRALLLLQEKGFIKLKGDVGFKPSVADITENAKRLKFVEIDAAQAPRVLDDVDAGVVNTNYATQAGLNPVKDAILREDPKGPYVNLIAVREQDKDKPWVKTLVEAYHTPEVKAFVEQKFGGAVLAGW